MYERFLLDCVVSYGDIVQVQIQNVDLDRRDFHNILEVMKEIKKLLYVVNVFNVLLGISFHFVMINMK